MTLRDTFILLTHSYESLAEATRLDYVPLPPWGCSDCDGCLSPLLLLKGIGSPHLSPGRVSPQTEKRCCFGHRVSATARIYVGLSSLRQLSILNLKLSYQSRAEGQPRTNLLRGPNFPFSSCRRQAAVISHLSRAKGHLDSFPLSALQPSAWCACSGQKTTPLNCSACVFLWVS